MKKDEFYERFIFIPITIIVVSVLCIGYNVYKKVIPDKEIKSVEVYKEAEEERPTIKYKTVDKIKAGEKLIDINHASAEELMSLPEIGATRANAIVEQRTKMEGFRTLEDLICTDGIGENTFNKLKAFITISEY
jgi:competence protein ComEA